MVLYIKNFFTSGALVEQLAEDKIFVAGTIKERAVGFPDSLKGLKLLKGAVVPRSPSLGSSASCSLCHEGEVGLRRGKCQHCMDTAIHPPHHNTFSCSYCIVRLQNPMFC